MAIGDHLEKVKEGLQQGKFTSEQNVKQGIVERILAGLGWDTYDISVVAREFSLEGRRVDYALCHPAHRPSVFIEVKKIGLSAGADRQLFEYVFHQGVPMAILTDGQEWSFYLPAQQGRYDERRVYKLDLLERSIEESMYRLERYLGYKNICSGQALKDAQFDYQNVAKNREIEDNLPKAWGILLKEQDSLLLDLLADKVEDLCGYRPDLAVCSTFLENYTHNIKYLNNSVTQSLESFPSKHLSKTESKTESKNRFDKGSQPPQHPGQGNEIIKNKITSRSLADFHYSRCILMIESILTVKLIEKGRKNYQTPNKKCGFSLSFSSRDTKGKYWFGFSPDQENYLNQFECAYFVGICGNQDNIFLIPLTLIQTNKKNLSINKKQGYWHIHFNDRQGLFIWKIAREVPEINIEKYRMEIILNHGNQT